MLYRYCTTLYVPPTWIVPMFGNNVNTALSTCLTEVHFMSKVGAPTYNLNKEKKKKNREEFLVDISWWNLKLCMGTRVSLIVVKVGWRVAPPEQVQFPRYIPCFVYRIYQVLLMVSPWNRTTLPWPYRFLENSVKLPIELAFQVSFSSHPW